MLAHFTGNASKQPQTKPEDKPNPIEKDEEADKENLDKPLPVPIQEIKRPGTSGTELNLRAHRLDASTAFQRALREEQEYRARRQAINARNDVKAAKVHLGEAGKQFGAGVRAGISAVRLMPAVMREKKTVWRERRERKRLKVEKNRKEKEAKAKAEKVGREVEAEEVDGGKETVAPDDKTATAEAEE